MSCVTSGLATGAFHKQVSSSNDQLSKGLGGIKASLSGSYLKPTPA